MRSEQDECLYRIWAKKADGCLKIRKGSEIHPIFTNFVANERTKCPAMETIDGKSLGRAVKKLWGGAGSQGKRKTLKSYRESKNRMADLTNGSSNLAEILAMNHSNID